MLKNLKTLSGVKSISKREQLVINGGDDDLFNNPAYFACLRTCGGSCSGSGRCFEQEK